MTTTKTFDPTKPVQTSDGRKVEILARNLRLQQGCTIAALITEPNGQQWIGSFLGDGKYHPSGQLSNYDLVNIPQKRRLTGWLNVYSTHNMHDSKAQADEWASDSRIACLDLSKYNIEFEDGEGL